MRGFLQRATYGLSFTGSTVSVWSSGAFLRTPHGFGVLCTCTYGHRALSRWDQVRLSEVQSGSIRSGQVETDAFQVRRSCAGQLAGANRYLVCTARFSLSILQNVQRPCRTLLFFEGVETRVVDMTPMEGRCN